MTAALSPKLYHLHVPNQRHFRGTKLICKSGVAKCGFRFNPSGCSISCRRRKCSVRLGIGHLEGYLHRERAYCNMYERKAPQSAKRSESPHNHGLLLESKVLRSASPRATPGESQQNPTCSRTELVISLRAGGQNQEHVHCV